MKKVLILLIVCLLLLSGCTHQGPSVDIAATTLPVYEFTLRICEGTGLGVARLVSESVSCLHDYSLQVDQIRAIESAQVVVISGAGLEDFLEDALDSANIVVDASTGIPLISGQSHHDHHDEHHDHHHDEDPHIWLSVQNAKQMAQNICDSLSSQFSEHSDTFRQNLNELHADLDQLDAYATQALANISHTELVTFHDGFAYLAEAYGLTVLEAIEEESGSEASAAELIHLIEIIQQHHVPAIFTEINGSPAAASIIVAETGISLFQLDMAMSGESYFDAMYHNIDTLKEALG